MPAFASCDLAPTTFHLSPITSHLPPPACRRSALVTPRLICVHASTRGPRTWRIFALPASEPSSLRRFAAYRREEGRARGAGKSWFSAWPSRSDDRILLAVDSPALSGLGSLYGCLFFLALAARIPRNPRSPRKANARATLLYSLHAPHRRPATWENLESRLRPP